MPGIIIHTEIARQVALALGRSDLLNIESSISRIYFQGAIAPDIGVFPGCESLLSRLTHYVSSGELVRRLFLAADSAEREAFALGWMTHYFGDALIHPIINRQAGRIRYPSQARSLSWEDDPVLHLQVELGLDGAMFFDLQMAPFLVPAQVLGESWCQFLADIFSSLYGIPFEQDVFLRSHRRAQHYNRILMHIGIIHAAKKAGRRIPAALWWTYITAFIPAKMLEVLLGARSPYRNVSTVFLPQPEFAAEVLAGISQAVNASIEVFKGADKRFADLNLDTGEPAVPGSYRSLDRTRLKLEQLRQVAQNPVKRLSN